MHFLWQIALVKRQDAKKQTLNSFKNDKNHILSKSSGFGVSNESVKAWDFLNFFFFLAHFVGLFGGLDLQSQIEHFRLCNG